MNNSLLIIPIVGAIALLYTFWFSKWVANREVGTDRMKRIAGYITEGAMAFLKAEYFRLMWFVAIVGILLAITSTGEETSPLIALSFAVGALCSGLGPCLVVGCLHLSSGAACGASDTHRASPGAGPSGPKVFN